MLEIEALNLLITQGKSDADGLNERINALNANALALQQQLVSEKTHHSAVKAELEAAL